MNTKDFFEQKLSKKIQENPGLLQKAGIKDKKIALNIEGDAGGKWTFVFDSTGSMIMQNGLGDASDCTIEMKDQTFEGMMNGTVNVPMAFMMRKIKVKGDAGLAAQVGMALKSSV